MIDDLLKKYSLISEQVSRGELAVVLRCLEQSLNQTEKGAVVELGSYVGTTSLFISRYLKLQKNPREFFVYDSFEGLPEKSSKDQSRAGDQFRVGELSATKKQFILNYKKAGLPLPCIKKGWFSDLAEADLPPEIAFAFLDGDYYDSIAISLQLIWPRLVEGAVVVVDDYMNEALPGAARAVDEWLRTHPARLRIEQSLAILSR